MKTFQQFMEAKSQSNSKVDSIMETVKALQKVFKEQTVETRKFVWKKLTSKEGDLKVKELIRQPTRSLSYFRTLVP